MVILIMTSKERITELRTDITHLESQLWLELSAHTAAIAELMKNGCTPSEAIGIADEEPCAT
jgi:hypothetical protein